MKMNTVILLKNEDGSIEENSTGRELSILAEHSRHRQESSLTYATNMR